MLACETENLKGALMLAAYGADMRHVEKVRRDRHGRAPGSIAHSECTFCWSVGFQKNDEDEEQLGAWISARKIR